MMESHTVVCNRDSRLSVTVWVVLEFFLFFLFFLPPTYPHAYPHTHPHVVKILNKALIALGLLLVIKELCGWEHYQDRYLYDD
jgi:hypothetical protein